MNKRIRELAEQAVKAVDNPFPSNPLNDELEKMYIPDCFAEKFAELIVRECMKESMDEIVADEDIAQEKDPLTREYLTGNNQGIVDAVVRFRNHFGVEE